jgi:hypothetical protein
MSEQINVPDGTKLSDLAVRAVASGAWWNVDTPQPNALALPTRVLVALDNAGITTVEQLKDAGPHKLRQLTGLGKNGFEKIIGLLRALDRQSNNGES